MTVLNNKNIKIHDYYNAGLVFGMKLYEKNLGKDDIQEEIEARLNAVSKLPGSYRRSLKRFLNGIQAFYSSRKLNFDTDFIKETLSRAKTTGKLHADMFKKP